MILIDRRHGFTKIFRKNRYNGFKYQPHLSFFDGIAASSVSLVVILLLLFFLPRLLHLIDTGLFSAERHGNDMFVYLHVSISYGNKCVQFSENKTWIKSTLVPIFSHCYCFYAISKQFVPIGWWFSHFTVMKNQI